MFLMTQICLPIDNTVLFIDYPLTFLSVREYGSTGVGMMSREVVRDRNVPFLNCCDMRENSLVREGREGGKTGLAVTIANLRAWLSDRSISSGMNISSCVPTVAV